MTNGQKIVNTAESYKGKSGSFIWSYFAGLPSGASWCVGFILYVLIKAGFGGKIYNYKKTSAPFWVPTIENWLHAHATHVKMADAQAGDIVIFTWDGGGNNTRPIGRKDRDHIGFIRKKGTASTAYTIEGNTSGGKVAERKRAKTYIFAIYRLDCCKTATKTVTKTTKTTSGLTIPGVDITKGDTGEDVKKLQKVLNWALAGSILPALTVDGEAGDKTVAMIKLFQDVYHLEIDGIFGPNCRKWAQKLHVTPQRKAINWAVSVTRDNTFAYGTGKRAHHNGCYFCGTNVTGPKKATKGSRWEKTYCCNPFIHAAYAHGAGVPAMLKDCKKAHAAGMLRSDWTKYGFKVIGKCSKVKMSDMMPGDVVICSTHVWMYTGEGFIVEASGGTWDASSIRHKKGASSRMSEYAKKSSAYVLRYEG